MEYSTCALLWGVLAMSLPLQPGIARAGRGIGCSLGGAQEWGRGARRRGGGGPTRGRPPARRGFMATKGPPSCWPGAAALPLHLATMEKGGGEGGCATIHTMRGEGMRQLCAPPLSGSIGEDLAATVGSPVTALW